MAEREVLFVELGWKRTVHVHVRDSKDLSEEWDEFLTAAFVRLCEDRLNANLVSHYLSTGTLRRPIRPPQHYLPVAASRERIMILSAVSSCTLHPLRTHIDIACITN